MGQIRTMVCAMACLVATPTLAADPVTFEIVAHAGSAEVGNRDKSHDNSASVYIFARHENGAPVTDLITLTVGNATANVNLPGWSVNALRVGPGGCRMHPIRYRNAGQGVYSLTMGPGGCAWRRGDYVFSIHVDTVDHVGGGIGQFTIDPPRKP